MSYTYTLYRTSVLAVESETPLAYEELVEAYENGQHQVVQEYLDDIEDEDGLRPNDILRFIENLQATLLRTTDPDAQALIQSRIQELNGLMGFEE